MVSPLSRINVGVVIDPTPTTPPDSLLQAYNIAEYAGKAVLHAGRLAKTAAGWTFQPIGEAAMADPNSVARAYM